MRGKYIVQVVLLAASFLLLFNTTSLAQVNQLAVASEPRFWVQVAPSGFGNPSHTYLSAMAVYNNQLYAATTNRTLGGGVWRYVSGNTWEPVAAPGAISTTANPAITGLIVFKGNLYAGTAWSGIESTAWYYQIWRYNGTSWESVLQQTYQSDNPAHGFNTFAIYNNELYVSSSTYYDQFAHYPLQGARILRSLTGDPGTWSVSVSNGNGNINSTSVTSLAAFNGKLYAAVANMADGAQVWQFDGTTWKTMVNNAFGLGFMVNDPGGFGVYNNRLYLGVRSTTGGKLFSMGVDEQWSGVFGDGFGDNNNDKIEGMIVYQARLYALTYNATNGMQAWSTTDAVTWNQVGRNGFGNPANHNSLWSNAQAVYNDKLFIGTSNYNADQGAQIFQLVDQGVFLPMITH